MQFCGYLRSGNLFVALTRLYRLGIGVGFNSRLQHKLIYSEHGGLGILVTLPCLLHLWYSQSPPGIVFQTVLEGDGLAVQRMKLETMS